MTIQIVPADALLTTHAHLLPVSGWLSGAGMEHECALVAGVPAMAGDGWLVSRDAEGYLVERGGLGTPCDTADDVVWAVASC